MKEMNRRAFLKLSGASAALLALAACGGGSSAPRYTQGRESAGSTQPLPWRAVPAYAG